MDVVCGSPRGEDPGCVLVPEAARSALPQVLLEVLHWSLLTNSGSNILFFDLFFSLFAAEQ